MPIAIAPRMPETIPHELQTMLGDLHEKHRGNIAGNVATYIPELSKVNPDEFGVCVATANGQMFEAGDCDRLFTIQSISKPFTYALAMDEFGAAKVHEHVGVEPSGDAFNSIELHGLTNRPFNPMINTGAITVTALLHARHGAGTFDHVLERFSTIAGRTLTVDEDVPRSVKIRAARTGKGDSEVIEDALRRDLGLGLLERLWSTAPLPEDDAIALAVEAQHATRARR